MIRLGASSGRWARRAGWLALSLIACRSEQPAPRTVDIPPAAVSSADVAREPAPVPAPPVSNEEAVRAAFAAYKEAALARDGKRAADVVDRKTLDMYQAHVEQARTLDRKGLEKLDNLSKLVVLRIRHEFDGTALAAMTGRSAFEHSIVKGLIADDRFISLKIGRIEIHGDEANMSLDHAPDMPVFFFTRQGSTWQLAMWKTWPLAARSVEDKVTETMADGSVTSQEEAIARLIDEITSRKLDRALLDGPPR